MAEYPAYNLRKKEKRDMTVANIYKYEPSKPEGKPRYRLSGYDTEDNGDKMSAFVSQEVATDFSKKYNLPIEDAVAKLRAVKKSCEEIGKAAEERCEERKKLKTSKKAPAKPKAAAKKAPAKPKAAAKKAPAKKAPAKKAPAKKAPAKKTKSPVE